MRRLGRTGFTRAALLVVIALPARSGDAQDTERVFPAVAIASGITAIGYAPPGAIASAHASIVGTMSRALEDRGFAKVTAGTAAELAAPGRLTGVFAACTSDGAAQRDGEDCLRIDMKITYTVAAGRQSASASMSATSARSQRLLHSTTGRAGPYALEIPAERVIARSVDSQVDAFIESVLEALGHG